jgi:geranylgeranyl transferase type-2 subunit beta
MLEMYLQRLTGQLIDGLDRLPAEFRQRHIDWLRSMQNPDGGFSGREGGSDLYYTGFALRSLAVLQGLTPELCDKTGAWLRLRMSEPASAIDLFSLLVSCFLVPLGGGPPILDETPTDWRERVAQTFEGLRAGDGGYAKEPGSRSGSTYHSFLVMLALQLLDTPAPRLAELIAFVNGRRRPDGGYVEIAAMKRSGTNPTAAGVGILQMADALTEEGRGGVIDFLTKLPSEFEGGLRANDRIPAADLLSTFTGSWTLAQLGALDRLDVGAVRDYAASCEVPAGGFRGGLWDDGFDVEYTFYGLGTLGLLAEP